MFVSSHLLSEIEQIASHVGVLHAGRLCFEGRLAELRGRVQARLLVRCDDAQRATELLLAAGEIVASSNTDTLVISLAHRSEAEINRILVGQGVAVHHLARELASLESLFFDLTATPSSRGTA